MALHSRTARAIAAAVVQAGGFVWSPAAGSRHGAWLSGTGRAAACSACTLHHDGRGFHSSATAAARELASLADFQAAIQGSADRPLIIDFYADWCKPCKELLPRLEAAVSAASSHVDLVKINIDKPEFAPVLKQIQVQSVPTLLAVVGARMLDVKVGGLSDAELKAWIDKIAGAMPAAAAAPAAQPAATPQQLIDGAWAMMKDRKASVEAVAAPLAAALEAPNLGGELKARALAGLAMCSLRDSPPNLDSALELAQNALAASPVTEAKQAVAMAELAKGMAEETASLEELAAAAAAAPADPALLHRLALKQFTSGLHAEAVESALALVKRHRGWEDGRPKATVLKFFECLGPTDALTVQGRKRLSNLLFV